jgi:hypothetical protein
VRVLVPFRPGRRCVVAITDDTDGFQLETVAPLYAFLDGLRIRVTKSVWAFDAEGSDPTEVGLSLDDPAYRAWVEAAAARGHEIALHCATSGDSGRDRTIAAHARIAEVAGAPGRVETFHSSSREALYWGPKRVPSGPLRAIYRLLRRWTFEGDEPGSPLYWLDVARAKVSYVRNYAVNAVDTLAANPSMPYEDPATPGAPLWFACSNGRFARNFQRLLSERNVRRLKKGLGVSVVYTHLAKGFTRRGGGGTIEVDPGVRETLTRCASDPEIEFAPAGDVLDRLRLIQLIEDGITRGEAMIAVPKRLARAAADVSGWSSGRTAKRDACLALEGWLEERGLAIEPGNVSIFDRPRTIGAGERSALIARWIALQAAFPAA